MSALDSFVRTLVNARGLNSYKYIMGIFHSSKIELLSTRSIINQAENIEVTTFFLKVGVWVSLNVYR